MEYLTEAHAALARPHMQEIQRRITELKESATSYVSAHGTAQPDDSGIPGSVFVSVCRYDRR